MPLTFVPHAVPSPFFLFSFPRHAGPKILIDFSVLKGKAGVDPGPIWSLSEPDPVSVFHVSV